jgi:hypothetical protein
MNTLETVNLIASFATAIGVIFVAFQIWQSRSQSVTTFEDRFAKEYRELSRCIPTRALLGAPLSEDEKEKHLDEFWHYFDLSNEQTFLRQIGRIRTSTWIFWRDGIRSNFQKPAFKWAWDELEKTKTTEFSELRRLIKSEFKEDPKNWKIQKTPNT